MVLLFFVFWQATRPTCVFYSLIYACVVFFVACLLAWSNADRSCGLLCGPWWTFVFCVFFSLPIWWYFFVWHACFRGQMLTVPVACLCGPWWTLVFFLRESFVVKLGAAVRSPSARALGLEVSLQVFTRQSVSRSWNEDGEGVKQREVLVPVSTVLPAVLSALFCVSRGMHRCGASSSRY